MRGKLIRENLRSGKRVYGTHVLSFGDAFTTSILAELEMDFVFICTEHVPDRLSRSFDNVQVFC